jgi:hypothetical protein
MTDHGTKGAEVYLLEGTTQPTTSERAALLAISQPGASYARAAFDLGISERALRVNSAAQAKHAIDRLGRAKTE